MMFEPKCARGLSRQSVTLCFICFYLGLFCLTVQFTSFLKVACASEGGTSNYTPGTYGDFAMYMLPSGVSVRENVIYYDGKLKSYPVNLGGYGGEPELELDNRLSLLQVAYVSETRILGGRYLACVNIPYVTDAEVTVSMSSLLGPIYAEDDSSGLGDIQVVPFGLLWDKGNFHIFLGENIVAPTGEYDADELVSIGRNYWGYETILGLTWLDPRRGHELSVSLAYMMNTKNPDTEYKTGDEFHLDYTAAQYFSESFGVGVVGYYYTQTTDDSGSGYDELASLFPGPLSSTEDLDGLRADGSAFGPAIMWSPKVGGQPLNIVFKWMNEYNTTNRFEGTWFNLSAAMSF